MIKSKISYTRGHFLRSKYYALLNLLLSKLGQRHLRCSQAQLVIFAFDHVSNMVNIEGQYERNDLELIITFLKENKLINGNAIDVGANIGNHSICFSRFFDHVFAFEPNPITFKVLDINSRFSARNVTALALGVSNENGTLPFHIPNLANISSARIASQEEIELVNEEQMFRINVVRLDDLPEFESLEIGLIKIDVEGHELKVVEGALGLIKRNSPVILFEQHSHDFVNGTSLTVEFLRELGYQFFIGRYEPSRSGSLSLGKRVLNTMKGLALGSNYSIERCDKFDHISYNLIIAVKDRL